MINTGFEAPVTCRTGNWSLIPSQVVPGWETTHPVLNSHCNYGMGPSLEFHSSGYEGVTSREGRQHAELNAEQASRIYQNICLTTGERIDWRLSHRGLYGTDVAEFKIGSSGNPVVRVATSTTSVGNIVSCSGGNVTSGSCNSAAAPNGWRDYFGNFVWSGPSGTQEIGFEAISSSDGSANRGNLLDAIQITLTPYVELSTATASGGESMANASLPKILISGATTTPLTVKVTASGTAILGRDYTTPTGSQSFTVTIPAGEYASTSFPLGVLIVDDGQVEENKTIIFSIDEDSSYLVAGTQTCGDAPIATSTYTITDDDTPPSSSNICDIAVNGSFESPNIQTGGVPGTSMVGGYAVWATGAFTVDGWQTVSGTVDILRHYTNASHGTQSIDLYGAQAATFRQTFTGLHPGRRYTFSVDYSGLSKDLSAGIVQLGNGKGQAPVTISTLRPSIDAVANGDSGLPTRPQLTVFWQTFEHTFTAADTEATIQFVDSGTAVGGTGTGLFIDNFRFESADPCSDLAVEIDDGSLTYLNGADSVYTISVKNNGPASVTGARITDPLPSGITSGTWMCEPAAGGAMCGERDGSGGIDTTADLPAGSSLTYTMTMNVPAGFRGDLVNTAMVETPSDVIDVMPENNTASDTNKPGSPVVTIAKVSVGGVGRFGFAGAAANANGFPTDGNYAVETITPGVAVEGASVPLGAADVETRIVETMPAGWVLKSARCEDRRAAASGNLDGPVIGTVTDGKTLVIPAGNARAGADLLCTFTNRFQGFAVEGRVILDNGAGGGTAHDGGQNGAEEGHGTVLLRLTDCAGSEYARGESDGAGQFSLSLAKAPVGTPVCLERGEIAGHLPVSLHAGDTGGASLQADKYDALRFTPAANTNYQGVVFGLIAQPRLATDSRAIVAPGGATLLPHRYTATTAGDVTFQISGATGTPDAALFSTTIYRDADCSGSLDSGEEPVPAQTAVAAGDVICLFVRVQASERAPKGGTLDYTLSATTALSGTSTSLLAAANRDIVTVGTGGTVTVSKKVRNETRNGPYGMTSTGAPGDVLEYSIIFSNPSAGLVSDVRVHDETPDYTTLHEPLQVIKNPSELDCQPALPTASGAAGYKGPLRWDCTGTMSPGAKGVVSFKVKIDQ